MSSLVEKTYKMIGFIISAFISGYMVNRIGYNSSLELIGLLTIFIVLTALIGFLYYLIIHSFYNYVGIESQFKFNKDNKSYVYKIRSRIFQISITDPFGVYIFIHNTGYNNLTNYKGELYVYKILGSLPDRYNYDKQSLKDILFKDYENNN